MSPNETQLIVTGATVLVGWLAVRSFASWIAKPVPPDPWGPEIAEALEQPDATPLCPHCQCPHELSHWFCPKCGRSVGDYNNFSPYLYLFSLGEVLREGTSGRFRKSWLTVTGFFMLSLIEYAVFAPIYWFFLLRNLLQTNRPDDSHDGPLAGEGSKSVDSEPSQL